MKTVWITLITALLVFVLFFWLGAHYPTEFSPETANSSPPPQPELKLMSRVRTFATSKPPKPESQVRSTRPQESEAKPGYIPKGNVIEFEIKDGLAVAYGDQIL